MSDDLKQKDYIDKEISIEPGARKKRFRSLDSLRKYIRSENDVWKKCTKGKLSTIRDSYHKLVILFDQYDKNGDQASKEQISKQINSILKHEKLVISSVSSLGKKLLSLYKVNEQAADGFWQYFFSENGTINSIYGLRGAIEAHLYKFEFKTLEEEKENTKLSLDKIIMQNNDDIERSSKEYDELVESIREKNAEILNNITTWKEETLENVNSKLAQYRDDFTKLEKHYREKLRLEGPAEFWNKYKVNYNKSGKIWTVISVCIVISIVITSGILLYKITDQLFIGDRISVGNTIRWAVILALVYSSLFYLLRITIRLVLSSFHLSRDANERLQLTHQYLSLLSENVIDEKQREIIIQSLFSRAETGLFKGDSTPAIPESLVNNIIRNLK